MRRELKHIQVLTLDDLRKLPPCGEFDAGIYFLWLRDELQYIGKSGHIWNRIIAHERKRRIRFDRHTVVVVETGPICSEDLREKLIPLERAYIAHYEPPCNCLYENVGT